MKRLIYIILLLAAASLSLEAQTDRREVRSGNRKFKKEAYKEAEIDYRKAVVKDSLSVAANYNLGSSLYRQQDWDGALKALDQVKDIAPLGLDAAKWHFNRGDVALQKKDYASAVKAFRDALLLTPDDLEAKENYIYAKLMLQNQQNGGGGNNQDQQDQQDQQNQQNQQDQQNQDQNQQDQDQQDQQQDQDQNQQNQDQQNQDQKISPQQAQQMLQAIQAKEKETQDKVKKEKADLLKARQKEKNW